MPHGDWSSLRRSLSGARPVAGRALWGETASVELGALIEGSSLRGRLAELRSRSVLVATRDQLTAGLALIELDGVARRLVLCPPDLAPEHLPAVIATASVDAVVSDRSAPDAALAGIGCFVTCTPEIAPGAPSPGAGQPTEWILLTSGTTGVPKLVVHTLATLAGAIKPGGALGNPAVWSTFYDIRRYGGLQIFLRAVLGGGSMVLSSAAESTADFLVRAGRLGVTHISGTPSHWRRALMSPQARSIAPRYARLSGEIADQGILDRLHAMYPEAAVGHAFASTEAGVAFAVDDGLAGFPASVLGQPGAEVEIKIAEDSLRIRSTRTALRYLDGAGDGLADREGFVDTGDMIEQRGERCHFVGRRGGIINVGGLKIHPEEVEAVINRHPRVEMSLVRARQSPITGAVVVADVVLKQAAEGSEALKGEILDACRQELARHKVPAILRFVPALEVSAAGKLARPHA